MKDFQFYLKTKIDFGENSIKNLTVHCKGRNAKKVLIVTDENLVKIGLVDPIKTELEATGISYDIYDEVKPNPEVGIIDKGGDAASHGGYDLIVAFGGGSSMDTAKGIAVLAVNEGSIYDYLDGRGNEKRNIDVKPLPIIAVPTTAGTGSEASMYSVITDEKTRIKDSITSEDIYPAVAIIDPVLMLGLPPKITAYTGLDVLGHALEAYTSKIDNVMTDMFAKEAIKLVFEYLPIAVQKGDLESRKKMAYASLIAGIAMSHCGATIPHGLGCPLSGHCDLPHGLTVGLLQIPMIDFNRDVLKDELMEIAKYIKPNIEIKQDEVADWFIERIRNLFKEINVNEKLEDTDKIKEKLEAMTEDALIHGCTGLNKRLLDKETVIKIYKETISR
ncbi:iron-containing alcohol dehydrogenase family protein [Abyssisolibacter fermentans]|uniref:iron-containing alcohol dehydrogenase family protein n=1 Tax=Abyssisolibacter fermentans TaxID=1766203 RepID=UPI00082A8E83|nr:iron-containing alcohol dehydrogenase [Abyssisolibacter fermentans]